MDAAALTDTIALGALSGMRSMAGPAALAFQHGGVPRGLAATLAAGEMLVDKMPFVGDRIDAAPLMGRAVMGALAGGIVAHERRTSLAAGALIGAAAAVVMAHLAFHARKRLPLPGLLGGLFEDAIVVGAGAWFASRRSLNANARGG